MGRAGSPRARATKPRAEDPALDPRLDDLPFRRFLHDWAAARGITTVRQLARVHPTELAANPAQAATSSVVAHTRAILERFLGHPWEVLAAAGAPGGPRPLGHGPHEPAGWDELRLVLPERLRALPLHEVDLPTVMRTYAEREALTTLGELARRSEAVLLQAAHLGRLSVHRTFLAVRALAAGRPNPVKRAAPAAPPVKRTAPAASPVKRAAPTPPPVKRAAPTPPPVKRAAPTPPPVTRAAPTVPEPAPAPLPARRGSRPDLLSTWRAQLQDLPQPARVAMARRAGLDHPAETYEAIAARLGVSTREARGHEAHAVLTLRRTAWMEEVHRRFEAAVPGRSVALTTLTADPWWARIAASPELLDYFALKLLGGAADVIVVAGAPYLARQRSRRPG
jgi:hypothetical protein